MCSSDLPVASAAASAAANAPQVFAGLKDRLAAQPDLAKEVDAIIVFRLTGPDAVWTVDMKKGEVRLGDTAARDTLLTLSDADLGALVKGQEPAGALFQRMAQFAGERAAPESRTPSGELVRAAGGAISEYFRSHPYSSERQRRLDAMIARNRRDLQGKVVYIGAENLRRRIPVSQQRFPGESHTF